MTEKYDPSEQDELLDIFRDLLRGPTGDGGNKRARGDKVSWKIDPAHYAAAERHRARHLLGELVDPDSGTHPRVHSAWRDLAIAYQEMQTDEWKYAYQEWLQKREQDPWDDSADMCPNCNTPWKCNGPHLLRYGLARWIDPETHETYPADLDGELGTVCEFEGCVLRAGHGGRQVGSSETQAEHEPDSAPRVEPTTVQVKDVTDPR